MIVRCIQTSYSSLLGTEQQSPTPATPSQDRLWGSNYSICIHDEGMSKSLLPLPKMDVIWVESTGHLCNPGLQRESLISMDRVLEDV